MSLAPLRALHSVASHGTVRAVARGIAAGAACALIGGCTPASPSTTVADPGVIAIVGVNVVPMTDGDSILPDRTVIVRDGRITAIGRASAVDVPRGALRIDARGRYLMPGLVDAHVHLEYFEDPAILALFLANGVTTVRNMDGRPYLLDWKRRIASGALSGPTIFTAGPILDGDPPARGDNTVVRDTAEARAAVAAQAAGGYDFVKLYTNLGAEAYRSAILAARERGLPVAGHVPRRMSLVDVLGAGQHSLEHLTDFDELIEADSSAVRGRFHWSKLYLAMAADSAKMEAAAVRVAASGMWLVPTMVQADRAVAPADSVRRWLAATDAGYIPAQGRASWVEEATRVSERLDSADWSLVARGRANRRAMLRALRAANARLAIGTDTPNPFVIPGYSVHQELAIFVDAGFSPREALLAATRNSHELLGSAAHGGSIEVGKQADLLLLAGSPLADVANARRPLGVMVRGTWITASQLDAMLARLLGR